MLVDSFLQVDFFFLRERKKKRSEGEEERGRKRGRERGNVALF